VEYLYFKEFSGKMIEIGDDISIDESEIHEEFIRSTGPGGQNVNKVSTAVQLRFDARNSPSLPDDVRKRLVKLAGKRINQEGFLVIEAKRFRKQARNREDALNRLIQLIRQAARKPRSRRQTKPTPESIERRIESKRRRGETKRLRRPVSFHKD
jgi:ribosome-associated protein